MELELNERKTINADLTICMNCGHIFTMNSYEIVNKYFLKRELEKPIACIKCGGEVKSSDNMCDDIIDLKRLQEEIRNS